MSQDLEVRIKSFVEHAQTFKINGPESFEAANQRRQAAKALIKEIKETFDPIVRKQMDALSEAKAQRDKYLNPAEQADAVYKNKMLAWDIAENKRIADEQERLRKEAQAKADKEKLAKAIKAEKAGDTEKANQILDTPTPIVAPPPPPAPKAAGFHTRMDWDFEIVDEPLVPIEYRIVDEVKIRKIVKALKGETKILGVRVFEKAVAVSR